MINWKIILIMLVAVLLSISCDDDIKEDFSYLGKGNYNGEFRIDGMYYTDYPGTDYYLFYYFWEDGTLYSASILKEKINSREPNECFVFTKSKYERATQWGAYIIKDNKIKTQSISIKTDGGLTIVNRSIEIVSKVELKKTGRLTFNLKFYPCNNKPDSTNKSWDYK